MRSLITILILCFCATFSRGGIIASPSDSDFVNTWALEIGHPAKMAEGGETESHWGWGGPETLSGLVLDDDLLTDWAAWAMKGKKPALQNLAPPFTNRDIQRKGRPSASDAYDDDTQLSDMDFALQGVLYIDWTGAMPTNNVMGVQTEMSQIPEPATYLMILMVSGLGLFVRRRFGL